jgi:uncharacterized tellurite resistance protein B-like protein
VEADFDQVIADPLRFKRKLRIGEDAYTLLRARNTLNSLWESGGAGWTGVGVAKSTWVASSFFAPAASTGVMGWLGLAAPAAAVTPIGWVVVAGLVAGGGYYGVTRWLASGADRFVDTIPTFINTPIDLLGAGLFDLTAPLAMQVARADGFVHDAERETIAEHFVRDWGFDPAYVAAGLRLIESQADAGRVTGLAKALAEFQRASPDCNPRAMQDELMQFLREVIEADGVINPREERALAAIDAVFKSERALISRSTTRRARSMAIDVRDTIEKGAASAGAAFVDATKAAESSLNGAATAVRATADEVAKLSAAVADRIRQARRKD